jgi:hypothetical protein
VAQLRRVVTRYDGWTQVTVVLAAVTCYELARLAAHPDWRRAVTRARAIAAWERGAHLAWEGPLQRAFLQVTPLVEALNVLYLAGSFLLTGLFFAWLYRRSRGDFGRFRNAFVLATAVSLLIQFRFPTAPPRLAGIGVEDTLRRLMGIDIGSRAGGGPTDPVAAMPSLHAGWALGVGVGMARHCTSRLARAIGCLYPLAVTIAIVVTGNHFLLDAVAGMGVVAAALAAVAAATRLEVVDFSLRRGVEQSGSSPGS